MHQVEKIRKRKKSISYDPYEEFRIPVSKPGKVMGSLKDYKRNRKNVRQILEESENQEE